ncbi:MAG: response regulator transcription factor [Phenylobacterium sp.]|jgi:two-component system, LuxR family, response regulator FixJ|uniref:response regulator transcription factor n=1 Tax=Phenylobacterium sp. TaxID=1871053 RepID=UPI00391AC7FB
MHAPVSRKPTVILVDDDAALRTALKFNLEVEGFEVETCESGEAFLLRPAHPGPSCVILDYNLPGATGLETLHQLRQRGDDTPALIITSNPPLTLRDAVRETTGARLVEKPLLGDALLGSIRELLAEN